MPRTHKNQRGDRVAVPQESGPDQVGRVVEASSEYIMVEVDGVVRRFTTPLDRLRYRRHPRTGRGVWVR